MSVKSRVAVVTACSLLLLGCKAFDASLLEDSSAHEAAHAEPERDAGTPQQGLCAQRSEQCNASDDDCDGHIDEGAEASCRFDHGSGACVAGSCALASCEPGYADCNRSVADGCEQRKEAIACGECGRVCQPGESSAPTAEDDDAGMLRDEDAGSTADACVPGAEHRDPGAHPGDSSACGD